jgi:hypothetical protein
MQNEEVDDPLLVLEPWHVGVEVHPVDALQLEGHMLVQDLGNTAW